MDIAWMNNRLWGFVQTAQAVLEGDVDIGQLHMRVPTVRKILELLNVPMEDAFGGRDDVLAAMASVHRAIGVLEDRDEWAVRLVPDAPQLLADELHPWVWDAARTFWESGHRRAAVQTAATSISAHLQDRLGRRDVVDAPLVQEAFSDNDPQPGKPRLRMPGDPDDQTVKSLQRGTMNLGLGCFWAVRNPATHQTDELPKQEALERLAALSLFARLAEQCEIQSAE